MGLAAIVALVMVLVFAGTSFFFALAETALFSLSKWQARQMAEREPGRGGIVLTLLSVPQDLLATMVLGNTFASAAMLAVALWMALHGHWPLLTTIAGLLLLILIGCEVLPKTMAVRKPERWALRVARPLLVLQTLALPLRRIAQRINAAILKTIIPKTFTSQSALTDADYKELVELAYQQGTSVPELAEYIGDLVNELAQMAKAANFTPLAYHLEMAMLEAERLSQDPQPGSPHRKGSDEAPFANGRHFR